MSKVSGTVDDEEPEMLYDEDELLERREMRICDQCESLRPFQVMRLLVVQIGRTLRQIARQNRVCAFFALTIEHASQRKRRPVPTQQRCSDHSHTTTNLSRLPLLTRGTRIAPCFWLDRHPMYVGQSLAAQNSHAQSFINVHDIRRLQSRVQRCGHSTTLLRLCV